MIAVDTNLLVYAHREDSDFHEEALAVLKDLAQGRIPWALPWPCVHEFIAITTHPRIFNPPSPLPLALNAVGVWIDSPACETIGEGPGYYAVLRDLAFRAKCAGPMVHDARIAAICIHHGIRELWTSDRDFSRFAGLKTRNPVAGRAGRP